MKNFKAKINYLYNSSFKVETENYVLIFDYYNDKTESELKNSAGGVIGEEDLRTSKEIIVFSSHSHGDHFNDVIFSWREVRPDIKYVLSSDISIDKMHQNISIIAAYEELNLNGVYIKAFSSTDIGISFLVKADGINLFHAGDLNWWHWYDEVEEENAKMELNFKAEIEKIKKHNIDIAFFPVDARLMESYALGGEYFLKEVKPKYFIPMHFREDNYITKEFAERNKNNSSEIFEISTRGEDIII